MKMPNLAWWPRSRSEEEARREALARKLRRENRMGKDMPSVSEVSSKPMLKVRRLPLDPTSLETRADSGTTPFFSSVYDYGWV